MAAAELIIEVQRNGGYLRLWSFTDPTGAPLDLTGATFDMDVKYAAGDATTLASFTVVAANAAAGELNVSIDGAAFASVPGVQERVTLAFDLIAVQSGLKMPLARGALELLPGVSNNAA